MVEIRAETWKKCGIETAIFNNLTKNKKELWLKTHDILVELGVKNMSDLAIKEIEGIYNKKRSNITTQEKEKYKVWFEDGFLYILSNPGLKIIMDCRASTAIEFRSKLGFN